MATRRVTGSLTIKESLEALRLLRKGGVPDRDGLSAMASRHGMTVSALLDAVDVAWPGGRVGEKWREVL